MAASPNIGTPVRSTTGLSDKINGRRNFTVVLETMHVSSKMMVYKANSAEKHEITQVGKVVGYNLFINHFAVYFGLDKLTSLVHPRELSLYEGTDVSPEVMDFAFADRYDMMFEIDPKTFGEMIDELSEDGEPYYTGDIFRVKDEPPQNYHYDVFLTYNAEQMYYGFMKCKRDAAGGCIQSFIEHGAILSDFKRIGNIHYNPELHDHRIDEVST